MTLERLSTYDDGGLRQTAELRLAGIDRPIAIGELVRGLKDAVTP